MTADKPLMVLIPGMDGTGLLFYRQMPLLAPRFNVVPHRLRDDRDRMESLVSDLLARLDQLAPAGEPAILVGESFGGALALSFALANPDRVAGLVILNSFPYFSPQLRLRLAILGVSLLPWGAMRIVRRVTAWRMHSRHTHRADLRRFLTLMRQTTRSGYVNRLRILTATTCDGDWVRFSRRRSSCRVGRPSGSGRGAGTADGARGAAGHGARARRSRARAA